MRKTERTTTSVAHLQLRHRDGLIGGVGLRDAEEDTVGSKSMLIVNCSCKPPIGMPLNELSYIHQSLSLFRSSEQRKGNHFEPAEDYLWNYLAKSALIKLWRRRAQ